MSKAINLLLLAEAVTRVTVAGTQSAVTVTALGRTFDTDRLVQVSSEDSDDEEGEPVLGISWTGTVHIWSEAVREAANRPTFPPDDWVPGPYEQAAIDAQKQNAARSRSAAVWQRLGNEAQEDDATRGYALRVTDGDIRSAIVARFEKDLSALASDDERVDAVDALMDGYFHGPRWIRWRSAAERGNRQPTP
jgi:hypothetical protein